MQKKKKKNLTNEQTFFLWTFFYSLFVVELI